MELPLHQTTPASTPIKPSGLPRPSRLPVLRARSSVSFDTVPAVHGEASLKSANAKPCLQKRSSAVTLPRQSQTAPKNTIASGSSRRHGPTANEPRQAFKPVANSRTSATRSSSRGSHSKSHLVAAKPAESGYDEDEDDDDLGSLNRLDSSSEQGSYDDLPNEPTSAFVPAKSVLPARERHPSRPSLSDRAIESLQNLPSTPKERRSSYFFSPIESPMGAPLRPNSSLSRQSSNHSRPGTSDGAFAKPVPRPASPVKRGSASVRPASKSLARGFGFTPASEHTRQKISRNDANTPPQASRSPSPSKRGDRASQLSVRSVQRSGMKTVGARPVYTRPGLGGAFEPRFSAPASPPEVETEPSVSSGTPQSSKRTVSNPANASSSALRQQIAAAKAAARRDKSRIDSPNSVPTVDDGAPEAYSRLDPFNQAPKDDKHILRNRIKAARLDGRLNVAAMSLKQFPEEVLGMYSTAIIEADNVNWAEVVDLTRLIAADNELGVISDLVFPDVSADELAADDQSSGNQFGGLEMLDLHGNILRALPMGLRRLERLTSLNLSHNKLDNSALDVVSQISSLKELRMGHNALAGNLPASLCQLKLETLDLQSNRLLGLPEAIREVVSLKVLNVSGNQLTALPMEALQQVQLTELDASNNALIGSLFPLGAANGLLTLHSLNVANNSLAALTFSDCLDLPRVRYLDVTNNHLTALPSVSGWTDLITLIAADNKITELPPDFAKLRKVKNVNLTSNELRVLDPQIARMDSLESLVLASNPLRDKKYLTMNGEDIKRDLRAKLDQTEALDGEVSDPETVIDLSTGEFGPRKTTWQVKANGVLDLSTKGLSDDMNDALGSFLRSNDVRQLLLHTNKLTSIPPALWLGQDLRVLDLSGNVLGSDYLSDELELPVLQELNLSHCSLTTIEPLLSQLSAPKLHTLNVTANRLTGAVPTLRTSYPKLSLLLAGDNKFTSVTAEALRGLHTVSLKSNNIEQLPAEIGLLWDEGLKSFDVGSNAFRMPNYRILDKGTEATLRWLREKLPAARREDVNGDDGDEVD